MNKLILAAFMLFAALQPSMAQGNDSLYVKNCLKPGDFAPGFSLPQESDGKLVSPRNYLGKYVVLNFWASWSPASRKDVERVNQEEAKWSSDNFQMIGVSFDTQKEVWKKFIKENNIKYPQVSELVRWKATKVYQGYHVDSISTYYLLDKSNHVMLATISIDSLAAKLESLHSQGKLKKLIDNPLVRPSFPGGNDALSMYIFEHMKYPGSIKTYGISGRVSVSFTISEDGSLTDVKVDKVDRIKVSEWAKQKYSADELAKNEEVAKKDMAAEALRVISTMPKWSPGKHSGKPVAVKYALPVNFRVR